MTISSFEQNYPRIDETAYVASSAEIIGQVVIEQDVSIWPGVVVRGDVNPIHISRCSNIQDGSVLHVSHAGPHTSEAGYPLFIGPYVTVGHRAVIHGCHIESHCLIGIGSIIMDGVKIQPEVVLGAGSLVPPGKTLESGFLYMGSPARKIRALSAEEKSHLAYSAEHYVTLKARYLADV